jgi:hypothetical protein
VSKYAPANENDEKPYVVTVWDWGRVEDELVYADGPVCARHKAVGPRTNYRYATGTRRATPEDVERLS